MTRKERMEEKVIQASGKKRKEREKGREKIIQATGNRKSNRL